MISNLSLNILHLFKSKLDFLLKFLWLKGLETSNTMGAEQSQHQSSKTPENDEYKDTKKVGSLSHSRNLRSFYRSNELNWIPSFTSYSGNTVGNTSENCTKKYIDLRNNLLDPPQLDKNSLQVCQIVSVALNYTLLQSRRIKPFTTSPQFWKYLLHNWYGTKQLHSLEQIEAVVTTYGACHQYQYNDSDVSPSEEIFSSASPFRHVKFKRISHTPESIRNELSKKRVVIWGMQVFSNFLLTQDTQQATLMPVTDEDRPIGGLCGLIVGFIEKTRTFIMLVARGSDWGDRGYIYLPESYLERDGEAYLLRLQEELIQLELEPYPTKQNSETISKEIDIPHSDTQVSTNSVDRLSNTDVQSTLSVAF